jgi:hypothetical protein
MMPTMYSIIQKENVVVRTKKQKEGFLYGGESCLRNGVSVKTKDQDQSGSSLDEFSGKSTTLTMMHQIRLSQNEEQ